IYTHWVENTDRMEQRSVAWFVYASDEYKRRYPDFFDNIKANRENYISHDNLFYTLLDCSLIESEIVDIKLSLCRRFE
ncbi:MAG: hypothetical protein N3B13_10870, partial [Deltaproteobacteria bacterium]|nr:hypothetical protein [Deltaproteobacteria bacterium]